MADAFIGQVAASSDNMRRRLRAAVGGGRDAVAAELAGAGVETKEFEGARWTRVSAPPAGVEPSWWSRARDAVANAVRAALLVVAPWCPPVRTHLASRRLQREMTERAVADAAKKTE